MWLLRICLFIVSSFLCFTWLEFSRATILCVLEFEKEEIGHSTPTTQTLVMLFCVHHFFLLEVPLKMKPNGLISNCNVTVTYLFIHSFKFLVLTWLEFSLATILCLLESEKVEVYHSTQTAQKLVILYCVHQFILLEVPLKVNRNGLISNYIVTVTMCLLRFIHSFKGLYVYVMQ